jgi:asparagine synthase (glutamine-hydrolysing)
MCGWVGVFGATAEPELLRMACELLRSRGPDGEGQHVFNHGPLPTAMGHTRLAILDPSPAGAQPMRDADREVSIVYNGEIYNSPELRRELEREGARFRSSSDTEVLLRGWEAWDDTLLDRIEGIFSFAVVDERSGRALIARDRLGVKPLYWAEVNGAVVAGSAPRAILSLFPQLRADLDPVALAEYLTLLWIPHPRTPWAKISKLPPGSALAVDPSGVRQWRYWSPPEPSLDAGAPLAGEPLREAVERATARQLLSDVPVGLLLSGGLDSSLLLAFMTRYYSGGPLSAVSARYDQAAQRLEVAPDDAAFARLVASAHPSVQLHEVVIDDDPDAALNAIAPDFDDPVADPAAVTLHRLVRSSETKVLLSGVGGEELFAGYPRHAGLALARRAAGAPTSLRRSAGAAASLLYGSRPGPLYATRRNLQKLVRATSGRRVPHYWRMLSQLTYEELDSLVPGAANSAHDELDGWTTPLARTSLADALTFDREQFLPNLNLSYVDKASMAAGVEVRVPLLDEMVVALAFPAPPQTFVGDGATKAPLRHAAAGLVPRQVIDRSKSGFGGPVRDWFRSDRTSSLMERVEALADTGLVARKAARQVVRGASTGRRDSALAAWALACLQAWHATHVASAGPVRPVPVQR